MKKEERRLEAAGVRDYVKVGVGSRLVVVVVVVTVCGLTVTIHQRRSCQATHTVPVHPSPGSTTTTTTSMMYHITITALPSTDQLTVCTVDLLTFLPAPMLTAKHLIIIIFRSLRDWWWLGGHWLVSMINCNVY